MEQELTKEVKPVTGKIKKFIYKSTKAGSEYAVALATEPRENYEFIAVGNLQTVRPGKVIELYGYWQEHPQYGWQLKVEYYLIPTGTSLEGIYTFLVNVPHFNKVIADAIIEEFGSKVYEILEQDPNRFLAIKGVGKKRLMLLQKAYRDEVGYRNLIEFLEKSQISPASYALKIYQTFGEQSIQKITENPYILMKYIRGIGFKKADEIALKLGVAFDDSRRIKAAIIQVLQQQANGKGHCYLPEEELLELVHNMVTKPGIYTHSPDITKQALEELVKQEQVVNNHQKIYLSYLWESELGIAKRINYLMNYRKSLENVEEWIREFEKSHQICLAPEQRQAVIMAAQEPFMLLTGGAGCGKSLTAKVIYFVWQRQNQNIVACAPTGRAAQRLRESIGLNEAFTIHRLLEYNGSEFNRNSSNYLDCSAIIVDESAMIDSFLLNKLLQALRPGTKICFIGDPHQLPPIGAGTPFLILAQQKHIPQVYLQQIFRQSNTSNIIPASMEIRNGQYPTLAPFNDQTLGTTDAFFYQTQNDKETKDALLALINYYLPKLGIPKEKIQFLSPMNKNNLGNDELNKLIQSIWNPHNPEYEGFRVGDRVIQTVNNYDLNLYNGDIGWIAEINEKEEYLMVKFDQGLIKVNKTYIHDLKLAYSISVHKAQGSEFPVVVIPITLSHTFMLNRNLIYTAFTRAKQMIILVGSQRAMHIAVHKQFSERRNTELEQLIHLYQLRLS